MKKKMLFTVFVGFFVNIIIAQESGAKKKHCGCFTEY
jgi:hypothetical protein